MADPGNYYNGIPGRVYFPSSSDIKLSKREKRRENEVVVPLPLAESFLNEYDERLILNPMGTLPHSYTNRNLEDDFSDTPPKRKKEKKKKLIHVPKSKGGAIIRIKKSKPKFYNI